MAEAHAKNIIGAGSPLGTAPKVLVMVHGRGGTAEEILTLASYLELKDYSLLAPQATNHSWYPYSFLAPPAQNEPWLSSALDLLKGIEEEIGRQGIRAGNIYFLGFSQGACLTLEYVARHAKSYGGVIAFTGGLIGDKLYPHNYKGDFAGTPIFIGSSDPDPHVPVQRVLDSVDQLTAMHARVVNKIYPQMGHTISQDELNRAKEILG